MSLAPGTRLGPYQLESVLGAGGMGEVYRARDTRLDRTVAIKVLSAALAEDREFRERFEREARSISALSHPNICALYDVGREDGTEYLVLEYLEGETLASRLARGPVPLAEALRIGSEIAAALDKAHRHGIVHRDLKPGNVMLTKTGARLLDFGLATPKAGPATPLTLSSAVATATAQAAPLTARGTILGTWQYMAPEQIEGEPVDARTDIFAFGAVLYEIVTGRRAFSGKSQASLVGAILKEDPPPVSDLQPLTPPALERIIRTCLKKDADDRFQNAHDLRLQLQWIAEGGSAAGLPAPVVAQRRWRERWLWVAAAVAVAATTAAAVWWLKPTPPAPHVVTRFRYPLPEDQAFTRTGRHVLALSPDGTKLVYVANQQLYLRAMDQLEAQPIPGTNEDPMEPVFSPDGQWLAYFTPAVKGSGATEGIWLLKKIAVAGGSAVTLCKLPAAPYGASWTDGVIAFAINAGTSPGILTVADSGGTPQRVITADPAKERLAQPNFLADRKHLLFLSRPSDPASTSENQLILQSPGSSERRVLMTGVNGPRVVPGGRLVYSREGTLFAVPFDEERLAVTGSPVPVLEDLNDFTGTSAAQFAVASGGSLAYWPGAFTGRPATLVRVDRRGNEQVIPAPQHEYASPRFSPDGRKIAVGAKDEEKDIWVLDPGKETLTRLTFGPAAEVGAVWSPDGRFLIFRSGNTNLAAEPADIFRKAADGTGSLEALTQRHEGGSVRSLSPDGRTLLFMDSKSRLALLPLDKKEQPRPMLPNSAARMLNAEVSPDGRWIAYDSDESGRFEIYVRPFPDMESGRWQVSPEGGRTPQWSRTGRELFYVSGASNGATKLVAVPLAGGAAFSSGKPEGLFDFTPYWEPRVTGRLFDAAPDGKSFVVAKPVAASGRPSIIVVSNWLDELKSKMAPK